MRNPMRNPARRGALRKPSPASIVRRLPLPGITRRLPRPGIARSPSPPTTVRRLPRPGAGTGRVPRLLALAILMCVAVYLPFRPEWRHYRQDVPATHSRTVAFGRPAAFANIRWRLVRYGPAVLKPGDLPPDGLGAPVRPGETLVLATLQAQPLVTDVRDFDIDYTLRDRAGHSWTAFAWHTTIYYGGHDPAYVMGLVPRWAVDRFELVMRMKHQDLSPALGGPELIFRR